MLFGGLSSPLHDVCFPKEYPQVLENIQICTNNVSGSREKLIHQFLQSAKFKYQSQSLYVKSEFLHGESSFHKSL
jgi:hypothetical protein